MAQFNWSRNGIDRRRQTYGTVPVGGSSTADSRRKQRSRKRRAPSKEEAKRIRAAVEMLERNELKAGKKRIKGERPSQTAKAEEQKKRREEAREAQRLKDEAREKRRQEAAVLRQQKLEAIRLEREWLAEAPKKRMVLDAKGRPFVILRKVSGRTPMEAPVDVGTVQIEQHSPEEEKMGDKSEPASRCCHRCSAAIEPRRLEALPDTSLCATCAREEVQETRSTPEARARLSTSDIERLRAKQSATEERARIAWPAQAPRSCPRCGAPTEIRRHDRSMRVVVACMTGKRCGWNGRYGAG